MHLQLLKLLDTQSAFYNGPCEGVYLRIDEDMVTSQQQQQKSDRVRTANATTADSRGSNPPYCLKRGKLVRPDFLQGIEEQWTRQQLTKNIIVHQY